MEDFKLTTEQKELLKTKYGKEPFLTGIIETMMERYQLPNQLFMEMIDSGWLIHEILKFCEICDEKQLPIESSWRLHQVLAKDNHPLFTKK